MVEHGSEQHKDRRLFPDFKLRRSEARERDSSRARYLTPAELQQGAVRQLAPLVNNFSGAEKAVIESLRDQFVTDRVSGVQVNGINVISLDLHHGEEGIHPFIHSYVGSPDTKFVVAEYFTPDLEGNEHLLEKIAAADLLLRRGKGYGETFDARLRYADALADVCAEEGKPVAVADIANKPINFTLTSEGFRMTPGVPAVYGGVRHIVEDIVPAVHDSLPVLPQWLQVASLGALAWQGSVLYQMRSDRGMFSKTKKSWIEQVAADLEHARRLYVAKGVEQLITDEKVASTREGEGDVPQIVMLYPKAHSLRIHDTLVKPTDCRDKVRGGIYKGVGRLGKLDFSLRLYDYNNQEQQWKQSDRRKIAI